MFFLYDMFSDSNSISHNSNNKLLDSILIQNGIFDHINLSNGLIAMEVQIPSWDKETIMDCSFNKSLEGGSISEVAKEVEYLEVQKKRKEDTLWTTLQIMNKDENGNLPLHFILYDNFCENETLYEYRVLALDKNGNQGIAQKTEILSVFDGAFISDANHVYSIENEYERNNSERNNISSVYTPLGSKYPIAGFNAETNYDSGSLTAILFDRTTENNKGFIDRKSQTKLIKEFNSWLTNGSAKIFKDFNGEIKLISIIDSVSNNYYKELGNAIASTSFTFIEIGEISQEYLDRLGITNNYKVIIKK